MKKIFKSERIFVNDKFVSGYLVVSGSKIVEFCKNIDKDETFVDYGSDMILPGFIDIHNHGFAGWSMTDPIEADVVHGFAKAMSSVGVTTVLPTATPDAFEVIAQVMDTDVVGARIYGIHSEGPFWARGGENTVNENYPKPTIEETKRLIELADNKLVFMAIAPERENAHEVIKYLNDQNIKVAIAHTRATADQIYDTLETVKIDAVTHLGNGMQGIHHRDVGTLGAVLLSDNLYYEIITDMNHINADILKIMFKLQPYEKFIMISDSNYMAGMPVGVYERHGESRTMNEKGLILNEDGRIVGSGTNMLYNIEQLVDCVDVPLEQAIKMSTVIPARFLEEDHRIGFLARNYDADFTIIDDNYKCKETYVAGVKVYDSSTDLDIVNPEAIRRKLA